MPGKLKRTLFVLIVIVAAGAGFLLVTGNAVLEWEIGFLAGVPAGNLIAWAGLSAWATMALWATRPGSWLRWPAWLVVVLALVWFPVSVALLGNLRLSGGSGYGGVVWLYYSTGLVALPVVLLVFGLVARLVFRFQGRPA